MVSFSQTPKQDQSLLSPGRQRYLVLNLPRWATDSLRRADPALAVSTKPLVLWDRIKGGMRVVALDARAAKLGLRVDQTLADARALVPDLDMREIDRAMAEHVFADFADWHSNVSPIVSVLTAKSTYGDLGIDITGVTHLFGGEAGMLEMVTKRLRGLGFTVGGAIASSIGAAWAAAHYQPGTIIPPGAEQEVLARLPVAALRLEDEQVGGLNQMGLKQVGQLWSRDRRALQARFGASLIMRLDQASGVLEERITPRLPLAEHFAERRFAEPIGLIDDVLMCARDLAIQLGLRLEQQGFGAQAFHLFLYRVDHKVMCLSVNSARATREPEHIARLFANRAERLSGEYDAGFGIDMIRLAASSVSELDEVQVGAFETDDGAADLDQLYDRMISRLGELAVVRTAFVNTHIPERATRFAPALLRSEIDAAAAPDPTMVRPLRLLPRPELIAVIAEVPDGPPAHMVWRRVSYRFIKASGAERIEAEWRRTATRLDLLQPLANEKKAAEPEKPDAAKKPEAPHPRMALAAFEPDRVLRDYYVAEDEEGRRFWLFRQGLYGLNLPPRWFLHGLFS